MNRHLMTLLFVISFSVAVMAGQANQAPRSNGAAQVASANQTATINFPLAAPGVVILSDAGIGSLAAGKYRIGVVAVNALGGESQFDPLGYAANNSITIGANHHIRT